MFQGVPPLRVTSATMLSCGGIRTDCTRWTEAAACLLGSPISLVSPLVAGCWDS